MIKKTNKSGWILCPSKSYPGKFYYFNVVNGEAAWSLNNNVKNMLKNEIIIQKGKKNYIYPEPVTLPDHQSHKASNYYNTIRTSCPSFRQAQFPKYIPSFKENTAIIWTPNPMNQVITNRKKMLDQKTQTEQDNMNVHTSSIPLSKRFQNNINKSFGSNNCVETNTNSCWKSTNNCSNNGKKSTTKMKYKQELDINPFIKESKLKYLEPTNRSGVLMRTANQNSTQFNCNKVEKSIPNQTLRNLDVNDLRYVLTAKRRKSIETRLDFNKFNKEHSSFNTSKKVTFNIRDDNQFYYENIDNELFHSNNENQKASSWYLVTDLDTLLEDFNHIKHYIDNDPNCHLYIPSVIENELKTLCMGEHGGWCRVIVARQVLRQLGTYTHKLNLPENRLDTKMNQIISCCLEIMRRDYDLILVTKDMELLHIAKLHEIQVYHINQFKSIYIENNFTGPFKQNLFLQNISDFDPFTISKAIRATDYRIPNISRPNGFIESNDFRDINISKNNPDISDIIRKINKLKINDNILYIRGKVNNNLFVKLSCDSTSFRRNKISKTGNTNISFSNSDLANTNVKPSKKHFKATDNIFEDKLKEFYIKDSIMEHNIYIRFDEWVCSYKQIIEDFLHIILQNHIQQVNHPPPWFLPEGMECLKEIYTDNEYIMNIIEKLLYYYDSSAENDTNVKPYNFMKLFGCGVYLVEALEKSSPFHTSDIKNKLLHLRENLEQPVEDLPVNSPRHQNTEEEHTYRSNYVKNHSYVLDYLKTNFIDWKNEDNTNQNKKEVLKNNVTVVRTIGKHLNKLTFNKSKCLSVIKDNRQTEKKESVTNKETDTRDPSVIRNIKIDSLNRETEGISSITKHDRGNDKEINDKLMIVETNDTEVISLNNVITNDNNNSRDSGFGSNSLHAYSLVRIFLSELSSSFKIVHKFILNRYAFPTRSLDSRKLEYFYDSSTKRADEEQQTDITYLPVLYRDESITTLREGIDEEKKRNLYEKANKTHSHIVDIIKKLQIIEQRESMESSTLKSLLIISGGDDKRTSRYRPVVMKCLEQAKILENSLKLLLAITNEEVKSVSSENINFINIYE